MKKPLVELSDCISCGVCAEVCGSKPIPALYMSHDYELARYDREGFMTDREGLYDGHPRKEYKK